MAQTDRGAINQLNAAPPMDGQGRVYVGIWDASALQGTSLRSQEAQGQGWHTKTVSKWDPKPNSVSGDQEHGAEEGPLGKRGAPSLKQT